ncbi:hypothetical protein C8R44DRAFT_987446 [Mycena epipterygia]|nr:hypothetical protein C8R44DRAFT_987446 [Mycena epipterygia]
MSGDDEYDGHNESGSDQDDGDVDGMLTDLIKKKPHLGQLMKKKEKERIAKEKRKEKKRKRDEEDEEDQPEESKRKKKGKNKASDDSEEARVVDIIGYIHVLKPTPAVQSKTRSKPKPETLYIKRGPFKFKSNTTYNDFLTRVAAALPCPVAHIVLDKVEWKPQSPANRNALPLGGEVGYDVLLEQIGGRDKDRIVVLSMPGPTKPSEDAPFWTTHDEASDAGPSARPSNLSAAGTDFNYDELEANMTEESVGQQKMTFDKAVGPNVEELKERWPLNDEGKRIYTDDKGFQWDLNTVRLNVWAAHMARGTATAEKAPVSGQFDIRNCIKSHPAPSANIPAPVTHSIAANTPPAPAAPSATEKLIEILAISMIQQHQQHALPPPTINPIAIPPAILSTQLRNHPKNLTIAMFHLKSLHPL